ncbi:unnamed protein product [Heligmosomoides polygyrus]|uniref:Palmitoyltransferase n=1 Tax=Heligmosomoides polygyrus TaxID=6339 RepID=A0A183F411_HELPZ|nr:unnamed protein product [Heligmosomoides polygyrus]
MCCPYHHQGGNISPPSFLLNSGPLPFKFVQLCVQLCSSWSTSFSSERKQTTDCSEPHRVNLCNSCHVLKPLRTHHCKICRRCILRMDHHCPLLQVCVHHHNHKFFLLFLFWPCCLGIFVTIITIPYVSRTIQNLWMGGTLSSEHHLLNSAIMNAMVSTLAHRNLDYSLVFWGSVRM